MEFDDVRRTPDHIRYLVVKFVVAHPRHWNRETDRTEDRLVSAQNRRTDAFETADVLLFVHGESPLSDRLEVVDEIISVRDALFCPRW